MIDYLLTDKERAYLKAVIEPFRDRVEYICKRDIGGGRELIEIVTIDHPDRKFKSGAYYDSTLLPSFDEDQYFYQMGLEAAYTLEDLGL